MKQYLWILFLFAMITACSTARVNVLPGETLNHVEASDLEGDKAESAAIDGATKYCRDRHQEVVFVSKTDPSYHGDMSETTRKAIRQGSKVAFLLGGAGSALERNAFNTAGALGTAGMVGLSMTSDRAYKASAEFKCR